MLLMPDKKRLATIIIDGRKPDFVQRMGDKSENKPYDMSEVEDDEYSGVGLDSAAQKVMSALKGGDASKLKDALKDFIELCGR